MQTDKYLHQFDLGDGKEGSLFYVNDMIAKHWLAHDVIKRQILHFSEVILSSSQFVSHDMTYPSISIYFLYALYSKALLIESQNIEDLPLLINPRSPTLSISYPRLLHALHALQIRDVRDNDYICNRSSGFVT